MARTSKSNQVDLSPLTPALARLDYLASRWKDESEYEPFAQYVDAFRASLPSGATLIELSQHFAAVIEYRGLRLSIVLTAKAVKVVQL